MRFFCTFNTAVRRFSAIALLLMFAVLASPAQTSGKTAYDYINAFTLDGGRAEVSNLTLKRDRVVMNFTGTFYFTAPVEGKVIGAVFVGKGSLTAAMPPSEFERANVRRMLKSDGLSSDFSTAVLQFSDDTFATIGQNRAEGTATSEAQKLASEIGPRVREETGANIASRIAIAILNGEKSGFFFASFDGGQLGRFSYLLDPQCRIPTANFNLNGGEKGLIYSYRPSLLSSEVWMAFYGEQDYARSAVAYSDMDDLVDVTHYDIQLDLRSPKSKLGLRTKVIMQPRSEGVRAIPFTIGESLGTADDARLKKQMRVKSAWLGAAAVDVVQEDWESGFTVLLPQAVPTKQPLELEFVLEGDFLRQAELVADCSYPRSNTSWYPRHGYLDRSTYDLEFTHSKKLKVATVGQREAEAASPEDKDVVVTRYKMRSPVALVTFALGPWERQPESIKWDTGEKPIPLEFNSVPGSYRAIKEDFILAELNNSVRYFHSLFGTYPYETYSATFHPYGFGQGFPSMLMIPATDHSNKHTFAFIAHETAHQWWGNIVAWRSYRDQWLSEGFAEYSGVLYTALRESPKASRSLIDQMRDSLKQPPVTTTGLGSGRLNDVGPIIQGHRVSTSKTFGAYQTLIYNKGALVLRMLHFLLSDPTSGDDKAFFAMMRDFVERHRNSTASTDDFRMVANEHFARSPMGKKYRLNNLNWFFQQWIHKTDLPSFQMEYTIETAPDGSAMIKGNVLAEDAPEGFFMPLPVVLNFGGDRWATGTVHALGPKTPFQIKLPAKPVKAELDPHHWVLSAKTETK